MSFIRLSRLRQNNLTRDLISETRLSSNNLIMPYFVIEGRNKKEPIASMPGIFHFSIDRLIEDIKETRDLGIKGVLIFGVTKEKDEFAKQAFLANGITQQAIIAIKKKIKDTVIITDVCLCGFTTHGHCAIFKKAQDARRKTQDEIIINNAATLKTLAKISLSHAQAGADLVAPSAMMDGQVAIIRETLDKNAFQNTGILAYSTKYASNFYGPFREAIDSQPQFGNRRGYQMDYRNSEEALREIKQDIDEGADIIMVKPALAYLDIISRAKEKFNLPLAAYNVSGEYFLVKAGARKGIVDAKAITLEILTGIRRAGADLIITYHAKEAASWL